MVHKILGTQVPAISKRHAFISQLTASANYIHWKFHIPIKLLSVSTVNTSMKKTANKSREKKKSYCDNSSM